MSGKRIAFSVLMYCAWLVIGVSGAFGKGMDDSIMFRIDWRLYSSMPDNLNSLEAGALRSNQPFVFISSGNDEKYLCEIPDVSAEPKRKIDSYSGPTPGELIRVLYDERICSYWLDLYWTYELCHGRYVLQYHDDKETIGNPRTEYYLGNFRSEHTKMDDKGFDQLNPPTKKVDDVDLPYYPVSYRQGTVCDLTGKPRTTTVLYVCRLDAKDQIYSFAEISSCTYEVVVLTRRLCSHPSFQPIIVPQHEIICYSRDANKKLSKPIALIAHENERAKSFEKEYGLIPPQSLQSDMVMPSRRNEDEEEDEDDSDGTTIILPKQTAGLLRLLTVVESYCSLVWQIAVKTLITSVLRIGVRCCGMRQFEPSDSFLWFQPLSELIFEDHGRSSKPTKSSEKEGSSTIDHRVVVPDDNEFLNGKQCLYGGGSGWWKYEFCYGKKVIQYHDDAKGGRDEVVLGIFNEEIHKQWIRENPQKQPLKIDGYVILTSHIYTGGDVCEEENIHRSVEVRIRCRPSEGSQSAVTLFLLEPHTCQYVLGVESPRFCDLLQEVDEFGLLPKPEHSHFGEL
ncbi:unnamed protein product [Anisakis simplex]|uniref:Endoplasmic reticulum lectin 1 n=1 Tax=Anisakis simplex TaxID=6269 RepID=A0A0M3K5W7_ANISI|nr:unnamed protein product [Anisakis simplex]